MTVTCSAGFIRWEYRDQSRALSSRDWDWLSCSSTWVLQNYNYDDSTDLDATAVNKRQTRHIWHSDSDSDMSSARALSWNVKRNIFGQSSYSLSHTSGHVTSTQSCDLGTLSKHATLLHIIKYMSTNYNKLKQDEKRRIRQLGKGWPAPCQAVWANRKFRPS